MMANITVDIKIKTTLAFSVIVFVCKYIKSKWLLSKLSNFTIAKIYCNGKRNGVIKLKDYLDTDLG